MLTNEIAANIVLETSLRLNRNINIMNEHGVIIASGDASRIGHIHEGALKVLKTGEILSISVENAEVLKGSQPGINLPIVFQERIVGVIGITGSPAEIQDFGGLVKMTTELMIKQNFIITQMEWKQRTKEMIIEELLKTEPSYNHIKLGLTLLKKQLDPPYVSCIIQIIEQPIPNNTLIKNLEFILGEQPAIISSINIKRIFIALSECDPFEIENVFNRIAKELKRLKVTFRLSFSTLFNTLNKFSESYFDCELALNITDHKVEIIPYSKLEAKALIYKTEHVEAEKFAKRIINKTLEKYSETLETFFDHNLNIQRTADALFIHRNTLIYRLNKIQEETGYDPKLFRDALTLQIAIWAAKRVKND